MSSKATSRQYFYNETVLILNYSKRLYNEYLNSNKKFIYASILRKVNGRLYDGLQDSLSSLEEKSHANAIEHASFRCMDDNLGFRI